MKKVLGFLFISIVLFSACSKETVEPNTPVNTSTNNSPSNPPAPPAPVPFSAKFVYTVPDPNNIFEYQRIKFKSEGSGITSWVWTFGDGSKQYTQNPEMYYLIHGFYDVTLTVTDKDGKTATSKQEISILCNFGGGTH